MLDWIDHLFKVWPIAGGIYDQWSGELISQLLAKRGYGLRLTMVNLAARQKTRSCGRGFARRSCPAS